MTFHNKNKLTMIFEIDDIIPFVKRKEHINHTIRQIIRYDSGYLKDLFLKDNRVCFSEKCLAELLRLTKGHFDNWENAETRNIFNGIKPYKSPYFFDFNNEVIVKTNKERLNLTKKRKVEL